MSDIGDNIRAARIAAGMSMTTAAHELEKYGIEITCSMLGALERGERRLAAQTVLALSQIYACPIQKLYGTDDGSVGIPLTEHEKEIMHYIGSEWDGDMHALIEWMGMYVAADRDTRAEIAGTSLRIFREARNAGMKIDVPYEVRTHFISKKWGELLE